MSKFDKLYEKIASEITEALPVAAIAGTVGRAAAGYVAKNVAKKFIGQNKEEEEETTDENIQFQQNQQTNTQNQQTNTQTQVSPQQQKQELEKFAKNMGIDVTVLQKFIEMQKQQAQTNQQKQQNQQSSTQPAV